MSYEMCMVSAFLRKKFQYEQNVRTQAAVEVEFFVQHIFFKKRRKRRKQLHYRHKVCVKMLKAQAHAQSVNIPLFHAGFAVLLAFVCRSNEALSSNSTWCFLRTLPLWLCVKITSTASHHIAVE